MAKFNPKVEEFLKDDPNKTLLGLAWSMYWRWTAIITAIYIAIGGFLMWLD
jgi:phage tail protein X